MTTLPNSKKKKQKSNVDSNSFERYKSLKKKYEHKVDTEKERAVRKWYFEKAFPKKKNDQQEEKESEEFEKIVTNEVDSLCTGWVSAFRKYRGDFIKFWLSVGDNRIEPPKELKLNLQIFAFAYQSHIVDTDNKGYPKLPPTLAEVSPFNKKDYLAVNKAPNTIKSWKEAFGFIKSKLGKLHQKNEFYYEIHIIEKHSMAITRIKGEIFTLDTEATGLQCHSNLQKAINCIDYGVLRLYKQVKPNKDEDTIRDEAQVELIFINN